MKKQCEKLIAGNPDARVVDLSFRDWGCSTSSGKYLRLWPHSFGTEGFFVAAFQENARLPAPEGQSRDSKPSTFSRCLLQISLAGLESCTSDPERNSNRGGANWPNLPGLLVEDDENLWLLPLAARLRWPHRDDSGDSGCMANHPDEPLRKVSNCAVQMSVLSKLEALPSGGQEGALTKSDSLCGQQ